MYSSATDERLKQVREYLGMTQQAFADSVGEKQTKIKDIETKNQKISPYFAYKIEAAHKINFKWLLTGEGEMLSDCESASNDYLYVIQKRHKFTNEQMDYVVEFFNGGKITREVFFRLMKAKNGDKVALEDVFKTLEGLRMAYE